MKKILLFLMVALFSFSFAHALATCTDGTATEATAAYTNVTLAEVLSITFGNDRIFTSFVNITPDSTFKAKICDNYTISDILTENLYWTGTDAGSFVVYNATDPTTILGAGNYTVNDTEGSINFSTLSPTLNNTLNGVCYNKTFTADTTDLVALGLGYYEVNTPTYGGTKEWQILRSASGQDWNAVYTYTDRTCAARDSCQATKLTIYGGFSLLAVAMIVLGAFALIKLTSGGGADLSVVTIGIIGLGIVLMVGYYIVSIVAQSICQAAVG